MKLELVNEIIECLGGERRLFCFYPGCHWVNTLVNAMQQRALYTVKCGELNTLCGTNVRDHPKPQTPIPNPRQTPDTHSNH